MKRSLVYAKDQLLSRAIQLPSNLLIEANSSKGKFELHFLSLLNNKQLSLLKKFAEEQKSSQVYLEFFTITENSTECPKEFKKFSPFDWENLSDIQIHRSQPYLDHADTPAKNYVTIVLVTKS